jgi:hypothetical protein
VLTKSGNLVKAATKELKLLLADANATMFCVGAGVVLSSEQRMAVTKSTIKASAQDSTGFPFIFIFVVFGLTISLTVKPPKMNLDIVLLSEQKDSGSEAFNQPLE